MAQIPSTRGAPQGTDIAVQTALPTLSTLSREDLQTVLNSIDTQLGLLLQDRNALLTGGGTVTVNAGATSVSFTEDLVFSLNQKQAGGSPTSLVIRSNVQTMTFTNDGDLVYIRLSTRDPLSAQYYEASTIPAITAASKEYFLIAKRIGTRIYFRNGTVLEANQSSTLDSTIASGIDVDSALPLIGSASDATLMSVLTSLDSDLALLYANGNIILADGGEIQFTGTTIILAQALKLHINSRIPGGSPIIKTVSAGTYNLTSDGDMLYITVDNRTANTTVSLSSGSSLPAVIDANTEVFLIAKRIDGADTVKRVYFRNGTMLSEGDSAYLGSSGGGSAGYARIFLNQ